MKIKINGPWINIEIYNTDLCTIQQREHRMDTIGLDLTSYGRYGGEERIIEAHLYPEDVQNLIKALEEILKEALEDRRKFHSENPYPPEEELTFLEMEDESEYYKIYVDHKKKELKSLFESDKWFDITRNSAGVSDTWGSGDDIYKEFMPFLVWNSETSRPEFVDERWKENGLYKEISWNQKYTKMKGINI